MGDENDGAARGVQVFQQVEQLGTGAGIERAGWLVGEDHLGIVDQGPRHGDPLLLATRELAGRVAQALAKAQPAQQLSRFLAPFFQIKTGIDCRYLDILRRRQAGEQIVALEDEAEGLAPQGGKLIGVQRADILATHLIGSASRPVEAAENVHQGRLARPGLADNRDELAGMHLNRDTIERVHGCLARAINPLDLLEFQQGRRGCHGPPT